jgi:hypothetical protein
VNGARYVGWGAAFRWDLKSARYVGGGNIEKPFKLYWTGDLNGDGIGDFITVTRDKARLYEFLYGTKLWETDRKDHSIPYKIFGVQIGCGVYGKFKEVWREETSREPYGPSPGDDPENLEAFEIRIEKEPSSEIPSVCIYSTAGGCTARTCLDPPVRCLYLSKWETVAAPPKQ